VITAPINAINEDYLRIRKNGKLKLSNETLEYLKYREVITKQQLDLYKMADKTIKRRTIVTYANIVPIINQKFLEFYDTV
jgi:hypothetical protein